MKSILPGLPDAVEEQREQSYRPLVIYHPSPNARRDRDVMDREKGKLLLERLRYKMYVRHGTLGTFIQSVGDNFRTRGWMWWLALLGYLMFVLRFLH